MDLVATIEQNAEAIEALEGSVVRLAFYSLGMSWIILVALVWYLRRIGRRVKALEDGRKRPSESEIIHDS